jgi:DNA modification methylase
MKLKISDVLFREDLYPRFEANQALIQKYAYSIEHLPPIKISQNNILIDGYHRWKAHQLEEAMEINADVIDVESEKELKKLAYQLNSNHGLQLNNEEKSRYAQEMIGDMTVKDLALILSVGETTVKRWTESQREAMKEDRNRKIVELYLRAWNTQESIADILGVEQKTVSNILSKNDQMGEITKEEIRLYNIWNTSKQDNATTSHFGSFPLVFMKNLLHYHTEPMDIIFDPFAGGGTTIDACKDMMRRYYCTDLFVKPGREKDILQHDINKGLPENLPKPQLVFLDPPYWKQAEGKYSDSKDDLSNMTLDQFYESMNNLFAELSKKKVERIAVVISPTQYPNNMQFEDHIFKFAAMLPKYEIEMRYVLPYSTQQYNGTMVDKAKAQNICLNIVRDLVVWRVKK